MRQNPLLRETKSEFYKYLLSSEGLNYFSSSQKNEVTQTNIRPFEVILEKRLALTSLIMDRLNDDPNLGRTKMAKVFYLLDVHNKLKLKTKYFRDVAGPMDSRTFYNEKIGIESLGDKLDYLKVIPGTKTKVNYLKGPQFLKILRKSENLYKNNIEEIDRLLRVFKTLDTKQAEILVTLYACWNDILIDRGKVSDPEIINEYLNNWNIGKKPVSRSRLQKALNWMKEINIVPKDNSNATHTYKKQNNHLDPF